MRITTPQVQINSERTEAQSTSMPGTTVVVKLHQGTTRNSDVYLFLGSFFGSFLEKQERTRKYKKCKQSIKIPHR
jgi:hypothetical protein